MKVVLRDQRRKAVLVTMSVAAAVAAIAITAATFQSERDDRGTAVIMSPSVSTSTSPSVSPSAPRLRQRQVVVDYGVTANVSLAAVPSGTRVGIDCRYENREADYGEHEYRYDLVAITRKGTEELVASWRSGPGDTYTDEITTAIRLREIVRVEVQSEHGQTILKLDL